MPPNSATLVEEGVVIDDFLLAENGIFREEPFRALLADAPYPARSPDVNVADIKAQIAANTRGMSELHRIVGLYGRAMVAAYMRHVVDNAEESIRRVIDRLKDGRFSYVMDDGTPLHVAMRIDRQARARCRRLHRHRSATSRQLQRAAGCGAGRGPLCLPLPCARRHPPQRRMLAADHHPRTGRYVPVASPGQRRGRRQYRGQPGGLRRAVRRTLDACSSSPGNHEQSAVREQPAPVLRNHLRRCGRQDPASMGLQWCIRT